MSSARRLVIPRSGPPSVLRVEPCDTREPGAGELRIHGAFAGINFADLMMRLGLYRPKPRMPFTPGYEASGTVDAIGEGVEGFELGDRVVAALASGGQQTHIIAQAAQAMHLPDDVELEAAAAIPVTYLTSWHMLVHLGHLQPGETVLIHGIAGGVGTAALQIAKLHEAGVVFGTASASKAQEIAELGGVLLDRGAFRDDLMRHSKGRGVDHVLDPIGGGHLRKSYECLAPGGRLYTFGLSAAAPSTRFNPLAAVRALFGMRGFGLSRMMMENRGVFGVHMGTFTDHSLLSKHLGRILGHVRSGELVPVVDSVFPLDQAQAAHEHIHGRRNFGKVLLDLRA
jgi:NADPH:quinone reductase-like Zn-dependent oxidoreductase